MEIFVSIAAKIAEYTVAPIGRQMGYVFSYTHNFHKLADQLEELEGAKVTIEHWVNVERRNGKEIEAVVQNWLDKVDKITEEAKKLYEDPRREEHRCSKCSFPNLWFRHQLSRTAKRMVNSVAHVQGEGKFERDKIGYVPPIGGVGSTSATCRFVNLESRMSIMHEIMQALADPKVCMLGVYGFGGMGKSTLVEQVAVKAGHGNLFDEVVVASVTQNPDLKRIQGEIADQLGLQFTEKTVAGRAYRLRARINKEKNILIILDDIWATMKLEEIGIPYRGKIYMGNGEMESQGDCMGCKVLLISRNQDVLQQMETQKDFRLEVLSEQETWRLFEFIVGDVAKDASYQDTAIEVAKKCAGLPVLIVTVARALKHKGITEWKDALCRLARVDNKELHEITYSALELSYNQLESDEVKALFLLCGVEGPSVGVEDLLKYVMGLGVFKSINSLKDARYRLHKLISALKASCLLIEDGRDAKFVRMHDLVHEVAISIASRDEYIFIRKEKSELKEWPTEDFLKRCSQIILRNCSIPELPETLDCAELKFLHLNSANNRSLEIPDSFFVGMGKLQVLDLTFMRMSSLPTSLCSLTNLQTFCLRYCSLGDVAGIGALKNLKILNLANSSMRELSGEIVKLTNLRMLDMSNSRIAVIPPNIISSLTKLEELYVGGTSIKWEVGNSSEQNKNASLAELKQLPNLTALDIQIQDVRVLPRDLMLDKLEKYKILIGDVWNWWEWFDRYETLPEASKTLKLKLPTSIHLEHGIKALIKRVESLYMDEMNGISNVLYELNVEGFPLSKNLHIQNNNQIQLIINSPEWSQAFDSFPNLETMVLQNLSKLGKLCYGPLTVNSLSKLKVIKVKSCDQMRYLFSYSLVKGLSQLNSIEVSGCSSMQKVVFLENGSGIVDDSMTDMIEFCGLRSLALQNLPMLDGFCSNELATSISDPFFSAKVAFPNLETLNLTSINSKKFWDIDQLSVTRGIQNLTRLIMQNCGNLKHLFSYSMIGSLSKLKQLEISRCHMMEEIIDPDEGRNNALASKEVQFPSLEKIIINDMKNLRTVWHCQFDGLKSIVIEKCAKLVCIFPSYMQRKFHNLEILTVRNCDSVKEIFELDSNEIGCEEDVTKLANLTLDHLPKLKQIWSEDPDRIVSFPDLQVVHVAFCDSMEYLFPFSIATRIQKIEELYVTWCGNMKEIVAKKGGQMEPTVRFLLNQLTTLSLRNLRELGGFYAGNYTLSCPSLKNIVIWECEKLVLLKTESMNSQERQPCVSPPQPLFPVEVAFPNLEKLQLCSISLNKIWDDHQLSASCGTQNLTCLIVKDCGSLKHLFTYSMVGSLPKLKQLEISKCPMMEEIIDLEEGRDKTGASREVQFPCLEEIKIIDLENLRTAWHCQFDSVKSMVINNCGKLVCIFPSYKRGNFHSLEILSVRDCGSVKEIFELDANNTSWAEDMTGVHKLTLVRLPKLKQIWSMESEGIVCFHNLQAVHVESCDNLEYLFPFSIATRLSKLEVLEVLYCGAMKTIVAEKEGMQGTAIFMLNQLISLDLRRMHHLRGFYAGNYSLSCPSLKKIDVFRCENLTLFRTESMNYKERHHDAELGIPLQQPLFTIQEVIPNLEKLTLNSKYTRMILLDEFPALLFSKLKILRVSEFEDEGDIFPDWFLRNVPSLENLVVEHSAFKEIFQDKIYAGEEGQIQSGTHVKSLSLFTFPKLQHVCKEGFQIDAILEVLETLRVVSCSSLINLVPSSVAFSCLTSVDVKKCNGLIKLITCATAVSLVKLGTMKIEECNLLEEIVTEREGEAKDEIVFGSLKILELISLPQLNKFCSSKCFIKFPMLRKVVVRQCPRMEIFSQGDTSTPNLHNVQVNDEEWCWENNLNGTIHKMFIDKVAFHGFKRLNLAEFSELKDFWYSPSVNNMFQSLKSLVVHKCDFLSEVLFTSSLLKVLQNLENLEVKDCDSIEAVFDVKGMDDKQVLVKQTTQMKKLTLSGLPKLKHIWNKDPHEIISFRNLRAVNVANCECLEYLFPSSMCRDLELLQELDIESCGVVEIVSKKEGVEECKFHFPQLTRMRLWSLSKLSNFYPRNHTLECPLLKDLNVYHCEALQIFDFNGSDAQQLHQVNKVDIQIQQALFCFEKVCTGLEKLALDSKDVMTLQNGQHPESLFHKINSLRLQSFHETAMIFPVDFLQRFPNLIKLVVRCSSFHTFHSTTSVQVEKLVLSKLENLEFIWNEDNGSDTLIQHKSSEIDIMPSSFSFKNLILLQVNDCKALIYLITSSIAKGLRQLRKMIIKECEMEYAVKINEEVAEEEITFQNLEFLKLNSLSRFRSFCSGKCTLIFPSLMTLKVIGCPKMKIFSPGVVIAPMLKVVQVENERKRLNGDLNTIVKQVFVDKFVPNLEKLKLDGKDVKTIWNSQFPKNVFYNIKTLGLECFHEQSAFPCHILERFPNLEKLEVGKSSFETIFPWEGDNDHYSEMPTHLNQLRFEHLNQLKCIWNQDSQLDSLVQNLESLEVFCCSNLGKLAPSSLSFQNLTTLVVDQCNGLIDLVKSSMARSFVQLTTIRIHNCKLMVEIVGTERDELEDDIAFNCLALLELSNLQSLKSFCLQNHTFKFPSLTRIIVKDCPKMDIFSTGVLVTPMLGSVETEVGDTWESNLNATIKRMFLQKDISQLD